MARTAANSAPQVVPTNKRTETRSQDAGQDGGARLLLTVAEAAYRLGIGRSLLYELLADGEVESIHVGRLRRIPAEALAAFIDRQRRTAADPGK